MDMPRPKLPYLQTEKTRHGQTIYYVRMDKKEKRIRIRGDYGSKEFKKNYNAAIAGAPLPGAKEHDPRTLAWLIDRYKKSSAWIHFSAGTRKQRDHHLYKMNKTAGNELFTSISKRTILNAMDRRRDTPAAANTFLKTVRGLFTWALDAEYIDTDPTAGIKKVKYKTDGFAPWQLSDVEKFREHWEIGTRERLAMELLLWTGLRRSDVVRLGRQHVKDGIATHHALKNGVDLYITIPDYLNYIIDQSPTGDLAYISTAYGLPRTANGFGTWFRKVCRVANIEKSAHGLRKTAATLLAEAGGTNKELQAAFGWKSDYESIRYTKSADRKRLSKEAANKRLKGEKNNPIPAPMVSVRETIK